jgi:hypothetical protein
MLDIYIALMQHADLSRPGMQPQGGQHFLHLYILYHNHHSTSKIYRPNKPVKAEDIDIRIRHMIVNTFALTYYLKVNAKTRPKLGSSNDQRPPSYDRHRTRYVAGSQDCLN